MIVYTKDEELIDNGAMPYYEGTSWCWFKKVNGAYDYSHVDIETIDFALNWIVRHGEWSETKPLMIDIECFDLIEDRANAIDQLITAASRTKSFKINFPIGFYRLIPERNYWAPVSNKYFEIQKWKNRNTANANDLLSFVDIIFPSIYAFNEGEHWTIYAEANLEETLRVCDGKQVIPVLMPSYGDKAIEQSKWEMMIKYCLTYKGVDALVIHTSSDYVVNPYWRNPIKNIMKVL